MCSEKDKHFGGKKRHSSGGHIQLGPFWYCLLIFDIFWDLFVLFLLNQINYVQYSLKVALNSVQKKVSQLFGSAVFPISNKKNGPS